MKCRPATWMILMMGIGGCVKPPYRYEVHDNGEGAVTVTTAPTPPESQMATPVPAAPPAVTSPADQQRIDDLEAKVKALSDENQKLKAGATTAPAKD